MRRSTIAWTAIAGSRLPVVSVIDANTAPASPVSMTPRGPWYRCAKPNTIDVMTISQPSVTPGQTKRTYAKPNPRKTTSSQMPAVTASTANVKRSSRVLGSKARNPRA